MSDVAAALARLASADWLRRPETQRLLGLLGGAEGLTRAVGGIVRDTLLDLPRDKSDIDFATELTPTEVAARAEAAGVAVYPTGIDHGTLTLRLDALTVEVTTLREDIDTDGRHAVVRFGTDWARDAARRDFTFNALYAEMDGSLFDPLGGLPDCLDHRVRFIGAPERRIAEDRLRVFRFFRFSASHAGETFDPEGLAAAIAAAPMLGRLAAERVGTEMRRMLDLPRVALTLECMIRADILQLPLSLVPLLQRYEALAPRPSFVGRLALLLSEVSPDALQDLWRLSNDAIRDAVETATAAELLRRERHNEAAYRHPQVLIESIDVAAALAGWDAARLNSMREALGAIVAPRFPIGGRDLLAAGLRPGPNLGSELSRLEQLWIESGFALERHELLALLEP